MAAGVANPKAAPTTELGTASPYPPIASWGRWTSAWVMDPLERVTVLRWPLSVRDTFPAMRNDTQLSGLHKASTLPVRRYVWGIDQNGAPPEMMAAVCSELGVLPIDDAWAAYLNKPTGPIARRRNRFSFDKFMADAFRAIYLGHFYFEQVYDIRDDAPGGINGGLFAHIKKMAPRAPWTVSEFYADKDGDLEGLRQLFQPMGEPPIPVDRLVGFVWDQDPGDWVGRSAFRSCFREWMLKDRLLRVDATNHEKGGGMVITEAPAGATHGQIEALSQFNAALQPGSGGAVPHGSNPIFMRAAGSDVIASINRHDEAMTREFLAMFMSLGTSSSGGNRALSSSFIDWFSLAQEAIAIWFRDVVIEHLIQDFIELNWGDQADYVPRLTFRRPEALNPLGLIAEEMALKPGEPGSGNVTTRDGEYLPGVHFRTGGSQLYLGEELEEGIRAASDDFERQAAPFRYGRARSRKPAAGNARAGETTYRRLPTPVEVRAAVDFGQLDRNWRAQTDELVTAWQNVRTAQIAELWRHVASAGGNLEILAQVRAQPAGRALVAAQLKAMAQLGAGEAAGEAERQGVNASTPVLADLELELETRAAAIEQLLANSISQAAANKAVQLSGGGLTPSEVAAATRDYLEGLTDAYLTDQFGGALSAAQNAGRLAVMEHNDASRYYASELLDTNTCEACAAVDGAEYTSAEEAAADYPAGGYRDCLGGPRCRGTVVAVYDEVEATV